MTIIHCLNILFTIHIYVLVYFLFCLFTVSLKIQQVRTMSKQNSVVCQTNGVIYVDNNQRHYNSGPRIQWLKSDIHTYTTRGGSHGMNIIHQATALYSFFKINIYIYQTKRMKIEIFRFNDPIFNHKSVMFRGIGIIQLRDSCKVVVHVPNWFQMRFKRIFDHVASILN